MLTAERIAQIVEHYRDLMLEIENSFRLVNGPMTEDDRLHIRFLNAQDQEDLRADLARGELARSDGLVNHIIGRSGLQLDAERQPWSSGSQRER